MLDDSRALREREQYNAGLQRDTYDRLLLHASHLYAARHDRLRNEVLRHAHGRRVLELGSQIWKPWLADQGIEPACLQCINISESELGAGVRAASGTRLRPRFALMNANRLGFEDASFDLVFGAGILHHLDLPAAVEEVWRVLRPGGVCLFHEPLGVNPVGKLVRALTPAARTTDERPLGLADLHRFAQRFESRFHYEQFLCIPAAALSYLLFDRPENPIMRAAFRADLALDRLLPALGPLYRYVLLVGRKAAQSTSSSTSKRSK